jgi:hypothetical protein
MFLCSCGNSANNNNPDVDSVNTATSPKVETSSTVKLSPTNATESSNNNVQPTNSLNPGLTSGDLEGYLKLTRGEAVKQFENNYDTGTLAVLESHMTFPCIFIKDLGITIIYPSEENESKPVYITVNKATNVKNISYKGAKPGMSFKEIKEIAGDTQVIKSWASTEDDVVYKLDYTDSGLNYSFVSYEESGNYSELHVSVSK